MSELKRYRCLVGGEWVDAAGGESFESFNPYTGKPWALIPRAIRAYLQTKSVWFNTAETVPNPFVIG